ncbi:hypothetical protein HG1285_12132 [Hydrogenivirga sp. 128-5-R1-1]|nr:hypothetical protein HG1285_12132 [Hydrogenivirga sp. 128-5-R1-1]
MLLLYIMYIIRNKLFSSDSSLNVKTLNRHPKKENTRNGYVLIFESPLLIFCENLKKDDQLELHFDSRFEVVITNEINLPYESNRENNKLVIKIKETKQSILITIPRIRIDEADYEKSNKEVEVILLRGKKQIDRKKVTLFS